MFKKYMTLFIGAVFILLLPGCSQSMQNDNKENHNIGVHQHEDDSKKSKNNYPLKLNVYTNEGKEIVQTINKEPKKVVVIGQAMAELMIEFGLQDRVVGIGYLDQSFSKYEDEISKMPVMSKSWPSVESIIALQPDIIYAMSSSFKEDRVGDISFWNERGIPTLPAVNFTIGRSIDEYIKDIENFGKTFNIESEINKYLEEQNERIDKVKEATKKANSKPSVLLVASAGRENYDYYPRSGCVIDEVIEDTGGKYVELSKDSYMEMSTESIIAANPEKIIITEFQGSNSEAIKNKLISNKKLQNVTAIKTGNVMVADYTNAIRGSLELSDLYKDVAEFIHPELFGGN
ncbi:ABC transporter substrate-binding protein [Metaclostridioides mangenotii]|uniref:ABC transporter substrate-binding protein n=1 Tax=Metaclostridioides mangenotii TaxID=1540 RepID=UPI0028E465C1|nr:ABC transporter substrate-binding protein [Clostridioides mangenotii]